MNINNKSAVIINNLLFLKNLLDNGKTDSKTDESKIVDCW